MRVIARVVYSPCEVQYAATGIGRKTEEIQEESPPKGINTWEGSRAHYSRSTTKQRQHEL
jgi:hypothetical protein